MTSPITVSSGVNSSGVQFLPNTSVTVLGGGEISDDLIQATTVTIEAGGSAYDNTVTDYAMETVLARRAIPRSLMVAL